MDVRFGGLTVSVVEPLIEPEVALTVVVPVALPVARPVEVIVAVGVLEEAQVTVLVMSFVLLSV